MAITDIPAFADLTDADIENLSPLSWTRSGWTSRIPVASATRGTSTAPSPRNVPST